MQSLTIQIDRPMKSVSLCQAIQLPVVESGHSNPDDHATASVDSATIDEPITEQPSSREATQNLLIQIHDSLECIEAAQQKALTELGETSVKLAMRITDVLVTRSVQESPERVTELVNDALAQCSGDLAITIYLNPIDSGRLTTDAFDFDCPDKLELVADDSVPVGDARINSADTVLIANLEQYLAAIETQLLEAI